MDSAAVFLQFALAGLTLGSVYGLVALGFTIVYRATDIINFGHGELFMLGGMITASLVGGGYPLPVSIVLALLTVALVAGLTERVALRFNRLASPVTVILATLAVGLIIRSSTLLILGKEPRYLEPFVGGTLAMLGAVISPQVFLVLFIAASAVVALEFFFNRTHLGLVMMAVSINREAAAIMGINVRSISLLAFVLSGMIGATAGIVVTPITTMTYSAGLAVGIKGFIAAAMGGMSSAPGAVVAGLLLGLIESFSAGYIASGLKGSLALLVGLGIILVRPAGLFGGRTPR